MEAFRRRLNLRFHWATENKTSTPTRSWISKILRSDYRPPDALPASSDIWKRLQERCSAEHPNRPNFTNQDQESWKKLTGNPLFYIIPADKGGKTVLWDRKEYEREALRQLQDGATYRELTTEETNELMGSIEVQKRQIISDLTSRNFISKSEANRLRTAPKGIPAVYFLPKIHKARNATSGTYVGRPIISACNGPLKPLDHFLAWLTKSLLPLIPGSLRDTRDLLTTLEQIGTLPEGAILFSADVEALYPSINADEGISASTRFYASNYHHVKAACRADGLLDPPDPKLFRRILTLIIKNNIFHFQNRKFFHQLNGTAMGASISVFFANTFMYYRTAYLVHHPPREMLYFKRYIDDIIGIWTGREEDIDPAFSDVSDSHIRLTYVKSRNSLAALDVLITARDGRISTGVYRKPTDSNQFIHWTSAHPTHLKSSIPYSQLLRVRRICSEEEEFTKEATSMLARFRDRGFPEPVLQSALSRVRGRPRQSLLSDTTRPSGSSLHLVVDYFEPSAKNIREACNVFHKDLLDSAYVRERQHLAPAGTRIIPVERPVTAFRVGRRLGAALGPTYKKGETCQNIG